MKFRRLISVLLVVFFSIAVLSGSFHASPDTSPMPSPTDSPTPSNWAVPEMNNANSSGLLTANAARDYMRAMTRDEFCEVVVMMAERLLGADLPTPPYAPFTDTNSLHINKAYIYGVVYGIGDDLFAPDDNIERQQIAAMMMRAIRLLEFDTGIVFLLPPAETLPYNDSGEIMDYAVEDVLTAYANGIMIGDDKGNFNPRDNITSQECMAVIIRTFNRVLDVMAEGKSDGEIVEMAQNVLHVGYAYGDTKNGVTRNILLESKGLAGVSISWSSNNNGLISARGVVTVGSVPETAVLTASLKLGDEVRTKEFILTTSIYTGDRLLVENAYHELRIHYVGSENADSVTSMIYLPNTVLGLPVTWSSSDENIITSNGLVNGPGEEAEAKVTLTASVTKGSETKTREFILTTTKRVIEDSAVSLHGIELGMTSSQALAALGSTAKRRLVPANGEAWHIFHTDYSGFIAFLILNGRVAAVYSMAENVANQLKNPSTGAVISVAEANIGNTVGVSYRDSNNDNRLYALLIYDNGSGFGRSRMLAAEAQEQLIFEFANAFRVGLSLPTLNWNAQLGQSARLHSADMAQNDYLSVTSKNGNTFQDRAAAQGFDRRFVAPGGVFGGETEAIAFFDKMVNTDTMSANLLSSASTEFGSGYARNNSSTHQTYLTYVFGTGIMITDVTTNRNPLRVGVGESTTVSLIISPSDHTEAFTWRSSNNSIMTLEGDDGSTTVTITGVRQGVADIVVTGSISGNTFNITVYVGTFFASSMGINYPGGTLIPSSSTSSSASLLMDVLTPVQLTAILSSEQDAPAVTWTSSNTYYATVSDNGLVTPNPTNPIEGVVTIRATVRVSTTQSITHTITVNLGSITVINRTNPANPTVVTPSDGLTIAQGESIEVNAQKRPEGVAYAETWVSSDDSIVTVDLDAITGRATVEAVSVGTATIIITLTRTDVPHGSIIRTVTVTVGERLGPATDLTLTPDDVTLEVGMSEQLEAKSTPPLVTHPQIYWTSADEGIAVVDQNGNVTAISVGVTTITAEIAGEHGPIFSYATIRVGTYPESIVISIEGGSTTISMATATPTSLTVAYTPPEATLRELIWMSSDESIAKVNEYGLVTPIAPGMVTITARSATRPLLLDTITLVVVEYMPPEP